MGLGRSPPPPSGEGEFVLTQRSSATREVGSMHPHSKFGWVWREPTAPRASSSDGATACAVGGWFLEYGWTTLGRNRTATSPATSLGRWFLRVAVNRHSAKPNRYPASDIPAERRSSHASS